jgi:outer membrane protein assembly factor BamB
MRHLIKFSNKIDGVNRFQILNNILYCIIDNKLNIYYSFNSKNVIDFESKSIYAVNNYLFSGKNFFYNPINNQICKINKLDGYYYMNIYCNYCLIFTNTNDRYIFYSLTNDEIIFTLPFFDNSSICFLLENCFIIRGENFYSCYDIKSIKKLWQLSFSDLLEGKEIHQYGNIVTYSGKLYFYLADNKDSKNIATVCLDINSGEILDMYKGFAGNLTLVKNKIYVASYTTVKILDLATNQIISLDFTNILKSKDFQIHWNHFFVDGNLLYFVDGHWATTNKLGILNLDTRELIWNTEIDINDDINKNIIEIKVSDNHLYVHCSDNTLHIFEKE